VRSLPTAMTLGIIDHTCIRNITILAPRTPTPLMTATIRLLNASTSMGLSHQTPKPRQSSKEGTPRNLTLSSLTHKMEPNSSVQPKEHNLSRFKNCKLSSTSNERTCAYFSRPLSESVRHVHVAEGLERELVMLIIASSRIGWANPQSSIELAKTSSPPPCFSAICPSHLPQGPSVP
jgi:hypothetical protein